MKEVEDKKKNKEDEYEKNEGREKKKKEVVEENAFILNWEKCVELQQRMKSNSFYELNNN